MSNARQRSVLLAISAIGILLLLALFVWINTAGREGSNAELVHAPEPAASSSSSASDITVPPGSQGHVPERTEITRPAPAKPKAAGKEDPKAATTGGVTLIATFARPDGSALELPSGFVELRDSKNGARRAEIHRQKDVRIDGLAPGIYVARVTAPEFEHRQQFLDLTEMEEANSSDTGRPVFEKRLVCWPAQWIEVIVEAADGRPLSALAKDLGYEPMKLFVGAFQVHTQLGAPRETSTQSSADPLEIQRGESELARFRPPPDYKSWEITKSCVGSLELLHTPPIWVELELFGRPIGWESLQAGARAVVFRIDGATLEERFARVMARVVDPKDHAPIAKALVTLRSDNSAHRREDLTKQPTDNDGRVELARVVPGRYEFQVVRGESQHQQMIELHPGESRDLGDITLAEMGGFDVVVEDETGRPMHALLEIGPYKKGARSSEMYPHMIRHGADGKGHGRLPMPSEPAIVRAAVEEGRSFDDNSSQDARGMRSGNVLIDPRSPPPGPLRLTLRQPVRVQLVTRRADKVRIEVLDELDVVVAHSVRDTDKKLEAELVPGRYRARTIASDGTPGVEVPFVADVKQPEIALD